MQTPTLAFTFLAAIVFAGSSPFGTTSRSAGFNDQLARGRRGAVVSANQHASRVGLEVLKSGGNAVDAAIATGFALAVTHPQAGNIGGGGFMVVRMADGREVALDYREMAPRKAHRDMYLDPDGKVLPRASLWTALAAGVPGSVAGMWKAHERFGSKPWKELVMPAVRLARDGFEVTHFLRSSIRAKTRVFSKWPATAAIFLPNGEPPALGSTFKQPDLAATLERIANDGPKGFYAGKTAELITKEMERSEGLIDAKDLAAYRAIERKPLRGTFRGRAVLSMPPPSSGGVALLQMLRLVEGRDLSSLGHGSAASMHFLIEAMKRAYADRAKWLGDPDFYPVPVQALVSEAYAKKIGADIESDKATPVVTAGDPAGVLRESRETTHYSVLDAKGNAVSCTTTLNSSFGNGQVVPGAGFLLNNEMDDFSAKPGVPNQFGLVGAEANAIAPGKRMLSSMTPTIVMSKDGKRAELILGSPGGGRIINTVFQVLLNVVEHGLPLQTAVAAPRIHQQWLPKHVQWERLALPREVRSKLEAMGHRFARGPRGIGRCQAIFWDRSGRMTAVADPRSPGTAVAY